MMARKYIILLLLLCTFVGRACFCMCPAHAYEKHSDNGNPSAKLDTVMSEALNRKLAEYLDAIKHEPLEVQIGECDFLIESTTDSLVRAHVAQGIYNHYLDSPVMGFEAVAIHVYDKWFQPGFVNMASDMDLFGAKIFAEFNRQSLIGCPAPALKMATPDNISVHLYGPEDQIGRFRVLYFYDTDCSKCRMQTILLRNLLYTESFPVDFYGIYTGDNREEWIQYIENQWNISPVSANVTHIWDPEIDSDFQRKYGILQTPRMFLVSPDGTIIGRGLDADALSQMLHGIFDEVQLIYGSDESAELFDGIFALAEPSRKDIQEIADHIAASTLPKGDTAMFRQMTGDLLYYLSTRSGEGFKEGLADLIRDKVLSRPKIWRTADDSLKVVGFAKIIDDLLSRSVPGSRISTPRVPGTLITSNVEKQTVRRLQRIGGTRNIIIFYTEGCNICDSQKAAARELVFALSDKKTKVFMVNIDEILRTDPALATWLFDTFDLSSLPFLLETDRRGTIIRRYFYL